MEFNAPKKLRKRIRIKEYDYSNEGIYFITICTKDKKHILSEIVHCRGDHWSPKLTKIGQIVEKYLNEIEKIYKNVKIDEYIIMPNHVHMMLIINEKQGVTIQNIIKQYKGIVAKKSRCLIWQKSFYEHVIRNEKEYLKIKEYIINNPMNWKEDKYY